ncbi:MAG: CPBP family intramembrane metalloprotease [Sandaracinaceae bacterium]|nr:CPBP family intramembrane metalloprotease [Sandaracinaceae bacterium]
MSVNDTTSRRIVKVTLAVYFPLGILGASWSILRGEGPFLGHPDPWLGLSGWTAHAAGAGLGVLLAGVTIGLTRAWVRRFEWARRLHLSFREIVGGLGGGAIVVLALASGIGEELFFRAGMQPTLGWVLASLIFGLVHIGPDRRFLPWTVWAVVMGFLLGAIYQATGSLLGPIVAHVGVNAVNLAHIVSHDPRGPQPSRAPSLVGHRERR